MIIFGSSNALLCKAQCTKNDHKYFKKYLSKHLALQFVAVRRTENKKIFKDTSMYMCMLGELQISLLYTKHRTNNPNSFFVKRKEFFEFHLF